MTPEEKLPRDMMWRGSQAARVGQVVVPQGDIAQAPAYRAVWGRRECTRTTPIPPSALVAKYRNTPSTQRRQSATDSHEHRIQADCPDLAAKVVGHGTASLCGCQAEKKNVCRQTLAADLRLGVDRVCQLLKQHVDALGGLEARFPEHLLLFQARHEDDTEPLQAVALLVDVSYNPKYQILIWCGLRGGGDALVAPLGVQPGMIVTLLERTSGLSFQFSTLHWTASDDLALYLDNSCAEWSLQELEWEFPDGTTNLLDMKIKGLKSALHVPDKVPRKKKQTPVNRALRTLEILDQGDPFEIESAEGGGGGGTEASGPSSSRPVQDTHAAELRDAELLLADLNNINWEGLPPDLVRDMLQEVAHQGGLAPDDIGSDEASLAGEDSTADEEEVEEATPPVSGGVMLHRPRER